MAEVPLPTPTQVPVPSTDIRNAVFAGAKLDEEVTGAGEFYTDRLGVKRLTNTGRNNQFDAAQLDRANRFEQFLLSSGYVFLGDYEDGPFQFSARNQYIRYDNQYYRLNATTDVGFTTTGTDATSFANDVTHFVLMDGDTLRQNLGSSDDGLGDNLIAHKIASSDSQSLTVYDKLVSMISVLDFIPRAEHEAIRDKTSTLDLTLYFQKAAAYALTVRKRVYIPAGQYYVTSGSFQSGLGVVGDGMGNSILVTGVGTGAVIESLGYWSSGDSWKNAETCVLQDFSVQVPQGNFYAYDSSFSIGYDYSKTTTETPIQLGYYKRLEIRSVGVSWSRGFSILATRNQELLITGCHIDHSMRDAIRALSNEHTQVVNNIVRHSGDDAITVGTNFGGEDLTPWGDVKEKTVHVSGNTCIDTKSIRALGAMNTIIVNNIMQRPKESAIIVGGRDGTEGMNDPGFVLVAGNIINDPISGVLIYAAGGSNTANNSEWNTGITLMARIAAAGAASAIPGQFDYTNMKWVLPETYYLSSIGSESPSGGARGIHITNNQIQRTLPYTGNYSAWGFDGTVFTPTGWVDPDMSTAMRTGKGINVRSNGTSVLFAFMGLCIADNRICGFNIPIDLSPARYLAFTSVIRNEITRYATSGLKLTSGNFGNSARLGVPQGSLDIKGNRFDADPYLEHVNRNTNGTWNSTDYPAGVECSNATGLDMQGNSFRNLVSPATGRLRFLNNAADPSVNGTGICRNNTFICQPATNWSDSTAGTADNAGVRFIMSPAENDFIIENSNPLSATYLQVLGSTGAKSAPSIPSSGFYVKGTFVKNTEPGIVSETITDSGGSTFVHKYVITGWIRLTTGTTNISGTDWAISKATITMSPS
ncbi:right-handed parallel beta-helix repeat-containing protein [Klebsiella michiganensis]|uniref:right-handed parallel beta-helix repeat-containing protein n=3 Tax=Klebsiella TaxID=570 RepID=UPI001BD6D68C|nr:right-handed parallel beta-helix repeat-containing protein [Klebsiella michiganensis]